MALETVTGFITSFARNTDQLPGLQLAFVPTGNGVHGDHLFVTREVPATVTQSTGAFTVQLERTDEIYGVPDGSLRYFPRITWQNGVGRFISQDFVNWRVHVPLGGGTLEELLDAPTNADSLYWSYAPTYAALVKEMGTISIGTWIYWATAPEDAPDNWFEVEA
ncbi:hypothetical protein [Herbiconiux sp.]|uniref:hypothetical protein n=1 Tax=Herbiconiux sp. TaxID=1871186 RepID=UPI0025C0B4A7|nr:hypothetical protein [Herbiconiux sp.]